VRVNTGDVSAGISLLRSGSAAYGETGARTRIPYHAGLLAKACEIAGQLDEALYLVDEALETTEAIGERWFASELHRHKGELMLRQGKLAAAEDLYRQALAIARKQEASAIAAAVPKPVILLHRFTAGSPKDSPCRTSGARRRSSSSWRPRRSSLACFSRNFFSARLSLAGPLFEGGRIRASIGGSHGLRG
jgi:hypothetical protein